VLTFTLALPAGALEYDGNFLAQTVSQDLRDEFLEEKDEYLAQRGVHDAAKAGAQRARATWQEEGTDEAKDALNTAIWENMNELVKLSIEELEMIEAWTAWANEARHYGAESLDFRTPVSLFDIAIDGLEDALSDLAAIDPVADPKSLKELKADILEYRRFVRRYVVGMYKADRVAAILNRVGHLANRLIDLAEGVNASDFDEQINLAIRTWNTANDSLEDAYSSFASIRNATDADDAKALFDEGRVHKDEAKALAISMRRALVAAVRHLRDATPPPTPDPVEEPPVEVEPADPPTDGPPSEPSFECGDKPTCDGGALSCLNGTWLCQCPTINPH